MAAHQNNLWTMCRLGELQMARELILAGADPNTRGGHDNRTCLMEATIGNHEKLVDLLLEAPSIEVNAKNNNSTALHFACSTGNIAILSKLLAVPGILVNERDSNGRTPIMSATKPEAVLVMAASEDVDLDVRSRNGRSLEDLAHRRAKYDKC